MEELIDGSPAAPENRKVYRRFGGVKPGKHDFKLGESCRRADESAQHPAVIAGAVFDESGQRNIHREPSRRKEPGVVDHSVEKGVSARIHGVSVHG